MRGVLDLLILLVWALGTALGARMGLAATLGMALGAVAAGIAVPLFGEEAARLLALALDAEGVFPPWLLSLAGGFLVGVMAFCAAGFLGAGLGTVLRKIPLAREIDAAGGAAAGLLLAVLLTLQGAALLNRFPTGRELTAGSYLLEAGRELWSLAAPWWERLVECLRQVLGATVR